jgi:hypothetical protein
MVSMALQSARSFSAHDDKFVILKSLHSYESLFKLVVLKCDFIHRAGGIFGNLCSAS